MVLWHAMPEAPVNSPIAAHGHPGRLVLGHGHRDVCSLSNTALVICRAPTHPRGGGMCHGAEVSGCSSAGFDGLPGQQCDREARPIRCGAVVDRQARIRARSWRRPSGSLRVAADQTRLPSKSVMRRRNRRVSRWQAQLPQTVQSAAGAYRPQTFDWCCPIVCFVEAKQEKRSLAVRPLWSNPAGRLGSTEALQPPKGSPRAAHASSRAGGPGADGR